MQKWLRPFKRTLKNYEDVGCLPFALEHDRGFGGDKIYRLVKQSSDGTYFTLECGGPYYNRAWAIHDLQCAYYAWKNRRTK